MNWKEGFRRIARAVAIVYWVLAILLIGLVAYNGGMVTKQKFSFERGGQRYEAMGFDNTDAQAELDLYIKTNVQTTLQAMGLGVKDPIITYGPWDEYQHKFSLAKGAGSFLPALGVAFVIYGIGLVVFRGLRWVVAGFMARREDAPSAAS